MYIQRRPLLKFGKESRSSHKLKISNSYIFATLKCKPLIFQTQIICSHKMYSLKYLRSTPSSFEDIRNKNLSLGQRMLYKSVNTLRRSRISPTLHLKVSLPEFIKPFFLIMLFVNCSTNLNVVFRTMEVFEENSKEIMTTVTKVKKVFIRHTFLSYHYGTIRNYMITLSF